MDVNKAKEEIIKRLGVKESTFYTWLRRYGDVLEREGIVKFAEKGDRKTLVEIDVERFVEFIKKRSKSPKESFRVEESVIKKVEEHLGKELGNAVIIDSPKFIYNLNEIFSTDFIVMTGNFMFVYEIKHAPRAEEFLHFLYNLNKLKGRLDYRRIKGCYCIITDKEIDTSMYRILLDLRDKSLDVNVIICKFKDIENLECCAEKFSLAVLEDIKETNFLIKEILDDLEVFDCTKQSDQNIDK